MTPSEHLAILGADDLAEIRRRAVSAPVPPAEVIEQLRPILAPAAARIATAALLTTEPDSTPLAA